LPLAAVAGPAKLGATPRSGRQSSGALSHPRGTTRSSSHRSRRPVLSPGGQSGRARMYADTVRVLGDQAVAKLAAQRRSPLGHFVRSVLAGMYVGAAIVLIYTVGGLLSKAAPGTERLAMGVCFGGALTIVVFAGSELFTGSN